MARKVSFTVLMVLIAATAMFAQVTLEPYGVSPAQIKADTTGNPHYLGVLDRVYSGLLNVGVETKMVLKGSKDSTLVTPSWSVTSSPDESTAMIGDITEVDTATQVATFIPDLEGTYVIEFADESGTATVTINAGTYVSAYSTPGCICHSDKVADWEETGHSHFLTNALDGVSPYRSGASCISCHTTGYDEMAVNGGFDDYPFMYPSTTGPGMADSLKTEYPEAMMMANIQCESCHGPGSAHNGIVSDSKMVSSLSVDACATCHDDDHYHVYPSQWESSVHGNPETLSRGASAGCAPCHSGSGFVAWIKNDKQSLSAAPELAPIGCAVCHDPHNADNEYQLRTVEATLTNGEVVTGGGNGKLCMNCHKSRRNAADYTGPDFSYSSHFGPHYSTQADLLIGTNVPTFGKTLPTSPHFAGLENACVDCHMYEHGSHGEHDAEGNLNTAGMHSFSMVSASGVDNVAACADCHGEFGESFSEKKYFLNGVADHDGDGVDEGLQEEIHGMLEELAMMLPPVGENEVDMGGDFEFTLGEVKAAYNYFSVEEDRSMGIHNPAFIVALLHVSMQAVENSAVVGGIAAVEDLPNDQGKQVKVIWNKFVDDGVAADPVQLYVVKRYDDYDETWTGVATHPADGSSRYAMVVPTVFDSTADDDGMTMFMVEAITAGGNVHHSEPADGYSVDNLVPMAPGGFAALIAGMDVNLSWDATDDPDVKYYAVHRSTTEGFIPSEETQLATTSELLFSDKDVAEGKYYYRVLAVDFSGNVGDPSVEVSANITSIDGNNMKPLDFALAQNYPNPFNPTTNIDFSLKEAGRVSLTVYNTLGQEVYRVVDGNYNAGRFTVSFSGNNLSSGVYVYRIQITGANSGEMLFQSMQKMILMK